MNSLLKNLFCILVFFFYMLNTLPVFGEDDPESKGKALLRHYEFEELVVKVKIQEPEVFFILDKPDVSVSPFDGDISFIDKIDDPIIKDNLF